jgi:ribosomal protein S18 acetylase RimI-like enzyme
MAAVELHLGTESHADPLQGGSLSQAPKFVIRKATPDDGAALGRLGALLVAVHHDFDAERFIAPGPRTEEGYGRFLVSRIDKEDAFVLVAEEDGAVLGYAYAGVEGPDWMALRGPAGVLYDIIVDPGRRREGLGRALLDAALAGLAERGAPRVVLFTAKRNEAAQQLFEAIGFRPTMIEMTREWPD